jgi:adenylylsulfate kinase-like enzyme
LWNSFARGYNGQRITLGTLYALTKQHGWEEPLPSEIAELNAKLARGGILVIAAFISPYRADRDRIREAHPDLFHEIFLAASVEQCERRDPKGLYAKARAGELPTSRGCRSRMNRRPRCGWRPGEIRSRTLWPR